MMPTLHVVDPLLINQGGHCLSQHTALWNLCQKMDFSMVSYTDINFDENLMPDGVRVEKVFGSSQIPEMGGHFCVELGVSNLKCSEELQQIDYKQFGCDDILFMTSATVQHAVAYGKWLREISGELKCKVGIYTTISSEIDDTLGRDIRRSGLAISENSFNALDQVVMTNEVKRSIYRYLIKSLPKNKAGCYKIFYEEPFVSRVFLDLCDDPEIEFIYLHSMYPGEDFGLQNSLSGKAPVRIAYLGSGGLGEDSKGQHLIGDIIDCIHDKYSSLAFTVQLGNAQTVGGIALQQQAIIRDIKNKQNVDLHLGMLSCSDYCRLIKNSDLMLLPYGPRYRHIMSGIFDDCLFLGKVCVIPRRSKMALWMDRHNLDYPGFTQWSTHGVIGAVDNALSNFSYYQEQFLEAQKICQQRWHRKNPISAYHGEVS